MSGKLSYGEFKEKLSLADLGGRPGVLTISGTTVKNLAPRESNVEDNKLVLSFVEFPDREYVCNATSFKTLQTMLGKEHERWTGKRIVMAPTTTEYGNEKYEKLHVAKPDQWAAVVDATEKATRAAAAKAPAKRGGKKA